MNKNVSFSYKYSAKENKEVQEIRKKYLPQSENRLEELRRLDRKVQNSGIVESLCVGMIGFLIFGLGLCLAMQVIGNGPLCIVLGALLAVIGTVGIFFAYPVYRLIFTKTKTRLTPRILELTEELSGENNSAL